MPTVSIDQKGWFYVKNNTREGPVVGDALRVAVEKGDISEDTLVWSKGMDQWSAAKSTPLNEFLFGTPPPLPFVEEAIVSRSESVTHELSLSPPTIPELLTTSAPAPGPLSSARPPWFERNLRFWRVQRVIGATLMVLLSSTYASATLVKAGNRSDGMLSLFAIVAGCFAFVATRKMHVVAQFRKTDVKSLHLKAALRSLGSAGIYSVLVGIIAAVSGVDFAYGLGCGLGVTLICYVFTVFSTYGAVRECRNNSIFGSVESLAHQSHISEPLKSSTELTSVHAANSRKEKPLTALIILNIILFFLIPFALVFIVPVFAAMFADFGARLPLPTQLLIDWSNLFKSWWWCLMPFPILFVSVFAKQIASRKGLRLTMALQLLILVAMVISMFLPIFQLSAVAGDLK